MDTSSSQAEMSTTFLEEDLYKAAVDEAFGGYIGRLDRLLTPNRNTVLHVYLANKRIRLPMHRILYIFSIMYGFRWPDRRLIRSDKFVEHVLNECPSLLFEANAKGEIPLHIEARFGHLPMMQLLIESANKADQEIRDLEKGMEPVKQMLKATDNEENMALHIAARYGHVEVARRLIQEDPDFVYPPNKSGETPLFIAARRGYHLLVSEILSNSVSVAHDGPNGTTALHAAIMAKCETTIKVILAKKKDVAKEVDENERTPLHYAAHLGCLSIVKLLLESDKSSAYKMDKDKMTPLLMAARQGYPGILKEIINHCPGCCELVDERGWNFLHFAVVSLPPLSLLEFLGAEEFRNFIDEKDKHGNTPLHVLANCQFHLRATAEGYKHDKVTLGEMDRFWNFSGHISSKRQEEIFKILEEVGQGEVGGAQVRPLRKYKRDLSRIDKARENHSLLAALIATITFAAVFRVPDGDQHQPRRNAAFVAFVITDAIALFSSLIALALHFWSSQLIHGIRFYSYDYANNLIGFISLPALVVAFISGMFATLKSSTLAVVICIIGTSSFLFLFWLRYLVVIKREC